MRMIKFTLALILVWVATSSSALTDEDRAFVDFLKTYCGETTLIGPPIPKNFLPVFENAQIGCAARFGMEAPCLAAFTTIRNQDGSYRFHGHCAPIPEPEATQPEGELKLP